MPKKHLLPSELAGLTNQECYSRWLNRKAAAHVKRDRARGHVCTALAYKDAIHQAVVESGGLDAYTGERLHWNLISTYDNEDSRDGKHLYKAGFALLPTVDHIDASSKYAEFKVCSWRANDAKNDMSFVDFIDLCKRVLEHAGYSVCSKG